MKRKKVSELAKQIRGVSYKPEDLHENLDENSVTLLRANNIFEGRINFDDVVYVDKSKVTREQYLCKGDILVCASSGSKQLVGKAASFNFDAECTFGAFCKVVRPNQDVANYLSVYFQSNAYRRRISEVAIGANINNIRNEHIDALELPIGSNAENEKVVASFSLLQQIIDGRKQQLHKLDDLVKARFVEMFGDPLLDDGRYCKAPLGCLAQVGSSKRIFEKEYVSEGIPFYRTKEIVELSNGNKISTELFITPKRYNEIRDEYGVPQAGDLLISAVGTIGVIWIVDGKNDFYFKDGNLLRVSNSDNFMPVYLKCLLETLICAHKSKMSSGTAYAALTISTLKEMSVYKVPLAEQSQFSTFASQVNKSKVVIQKALDKAQVLFDSLMQQYFG